MNGSVHLFDNTDFVEIWELLKTLLLGGIAPSFPRSSLLRAHSSSSSLLISTSLSQLALSVSPTLAFEKKIEKGRPLPGARSERRERRAAPSGPGPGS